MTDVAAVPVGIHTTLTAAAPTVPAQLFGSGLIGLREGLEAGIVVMVLVAFLVKSQRRDALKWVWLGVGAAVVMTVGVFLAIQYGTYTIKDLAAEAIAGVASLVAVAIVTSMVLWMRKASAGLSGELREGMSRALETGALAVFMLAFLAVGREGFETALFMVGYAEAETAWPLLGLLVGVLLAAGIACGMYAGAVRINLAKFFKYTGAFLIVVAAGHPVLRNRRPADGRLAARARRPGLRHQLLVQLVVLVRRDHPGRLQRHADADGAAAGLLAGLPRDRAHPVPPAHAGPDQGRLRRIRSATPLTERSTT